jgi:type III pantothenate kinase
MSDGRPATIAAVDIGNSRIKVGLLDEGDVKATPADQLPQPLRTFSFLPDAQGLASFSDWLAPQSARELSWWLGSVERTFSTRLVEWLRSGDVTHMVLLASGDLPLKVSLARPDMVGIDRLLDAVAVNRLRPPARPAIIVDLGTAITVDLVSVEGVFRGGAIMPGIGMAARALHEFTDLLPLLDMVSLADPPGALGGDTMAAMQSGIFWGAVGGIRRLIEELSSTGEGEPHIYLTGGAAPSVAPLIAPGTTYHPHLTLAAIAVVATMANRSENSPR